MDVPNKWPLKKFLETISKFLKRHRLARTGLQHGSVTFPCLAPFI